jgi:hypothetical protein
MTQRYQMFGSDADAEDAYARLGPPKEVTP